MEAVPVQSVSTTQALPTPLKQLAQSYLSDVYKGRGFPPPDLPCMTCNPGLLKHHYVNFTKILEKHSGLLLRPEGPTEGQHLMT